MVGPSQRRPGGRDRDEPVDVALARLEETLSGYDYDRALPPLADILADARVGRRLLREDDRAAKLLHEAIVARPLSSLEAVTRARTEVELLTLEVSVLAERLADPSLSDREAARLSGRLSMIRRSLAELRDDL